MRSHKLQFSYPAHKRLLMVLLLLTMNATAQRQNEVVDAWFLPGFTYQYSPALKLSGQLIYLTRQRVLAGYAQLFIQKNKHIAFNSAYLYLDGGVAGTPEHTLMNGLILSIPVHKIIVDNRNLLWNRFRKDAADLHFYRSRLRATYSFVINRHAGKLYAFDEVFYLLNDGKCSRNRWSIGFGYDIVPRVNVDFAFARQKDIFNGRANLFFVMGTVQLFRSKT